MSNPINTKTFVKLLVDNTLQLIEERDGYIRFNFFNMTAVEWKNWSSVLNLTSTSEAVRFIYNNEPPLVDNEFPNLANSHSNVGAQMLSLVFKKRNFLLLILQASLKLACQKTQILKIISTDYVNE